MGTMREELAAALAATGEKNASENRDRNTSMRAVANDIADAIEKGARIQFKASATCFQINSIPMEQRVPGDIYLATDAGVLVGEVPLAVQPNTAVLWDGRSWKTFLSLNLDNYYNKEQIDGAVNVLRLLIDGHATRTDNPHNVTAEQVGAISATALDEAIESEATARANADTALGTRIDEEVSDRQQADIDLQSQIDSITSKSDVVDVVDSYSELLAYDTSELGDNDVVKVLEDETHDNAESYYRWHVVTQTWGYIGSQGPFVTPAEMQTALGGKVDKVTGKGLSTNDFDASAKSVTDNIFLATYGSTSYADIKAAYDAGKTILCRFTDSTHTLRVATFDRLVNSTTSTSYAYFASVTKTDAYELTASKPRFGTTTTWNSTYKPWGALAEKDNVTNADINGTISDSHIASAATWNGKADKVSNATNGHLAGLDGNGNLTDSGIGASDIANKVFICIEYTTPFNDILAAYNAGKVILLASQDGSRYYYLMNYLAPYGQQLARFAFYYKDLDFYDSFDRRRDTYTYVESNNEWHNVTLESAKKSHASTDNSFGVGSETAYGHVQLTGSVTQNSSKAVKSGAVYDALQSVRADIASKQNALASNSLAFIYKPTPGDATKFLNEQGNFVHVDEIPIQRIVVGQTLLRGVNCLYSYGSGNVLYVMTGWINRRQSGAPYEMILRPINTENLSYIKVLITEQYVVYTVIGIDGYLYNKWNLTDSINTDVVLVTYKEDEIAPSFETLITAVHNRRDVLLVVCTGNGEEQEYYRLQWWKLYNSDNVYSFQFCNYNGSAHRLKHYAFDYNTGGVLLNVWPEEFRPISSVGTNNINNGAVTNAKLADFTIGGDKLASGAINPMHLSTSINLKYFITAATEGSYVEDDEYFAASNSAKGLKYTAKNARAYMNARAYIRLTFTNKNSFNTTSSGRLFNGEGHVESFSVSSRTDGYIHGIFGNHANTVILDIRKSGSWTDTLDLFFNIDQISSGIPYTLMVYNRSGNAIHITFRVNASTALTNNYVNGVTGTGNKTYTIDANSVENILIECEVNNLFLNATWQGF